MKNRIDTRKSESREGDYLSALSMFGPFLVPLASFGPEHGSPERISGTLLHVR